MRGPPLRVKVRHPEGTVVIDTKQLPYPPSPHRRSLYVLARRQFHLSLLNVFDQPTLEPNCTHREKSAVVQQSLSMLNSEFVQQQAQRFAAVVMRDAGTAPQPRMELAYQIALGRLPLEHEIALVHNLLEKQTKLYQRLEVKISAQQSADKALVDLCHMLLNTNEFLYLE